LRAQFLASSAVIYVTPSFLILQFSLKRLAFSCRSCLSLC